MSSGLLRTSSTRPITERIVPLKGIAEPFRAFAVRWEDDVLARPQPVVARRRRPGRAYRRPTIWLAAFVAASVIVATAGLYRTAVAPRNSLVTVAGLGTEGDSGDGGPAVAAQLGELSSLGFDAEGSLYLADTHVATTRIRRVDRRGIIVTVAGGGSGSPDVVSFGPSLRFDAYTFLTVAPSGEIYVASRPFIGWLDPERNFHIVAGAVARIGARIDPAGYSGDGGPAVRARLNIPRGPAVDATGAGFLADSRNSLVR